MKWELFYKDGEFLEMFCCTHGKFGNCKLCNYNFTNLYAQFEQKKNIIFSERWIYYLEILIFKKSHAIVLKKSILNK